MSDYYDPDDVLPNQSPRLSPVKPNYRFEETPPPLVPEETSSASCTPESAQGGAGEGASGTGRTKRSKGRSAPSYADALLIHSLDPNRPDIANHALQERLEAPSDSEGGGSEVPMSESDEGGHEVNHVGDAVDAVRMAKGALAVAVTAKDEDLEMLDAPDGQRVKREDTPETPVQNGLHEHDRATARQVLSLPRPLSQKTTLDLKPPPRVPSSLAPLITETSKSSPKRVCDDADSIATSPNLGKFTITSAEGNPDSTLPAMQMSPPRSSSAHSPDSIPTLPSIQTLTGHSPIMTRPSPSHMTQFGPSPSSYSHSSPSMSPPGMPTPGMASHPGYWRNTTRDGSISTPSDHQSTPSSHTAMTPSSTASYTPSIATMAEQNQNRHRQDSIDESTSTTSPQSHGQLLNGPVQPNGPFATNAFKCGHPGCTAVPFQTQYLLNSHANVHSSNRPHFCPVADCPRGPGGKGFKRKNEMIR